MCTAGLDSVKDESDATGVWDKVTRPKTVTEVIGKRKMQQVRQRRAHWSFFGGKETKKEVDEFNEELAAEASKTEMGLVVNNQ